MLKKEVTNKMLKKATALIARAQIKYGDLIEMAPTKTKRNAAIFKAIQIEHDNEHPVKDDLTEYWLISKLNDVAYYMKVHRMTTSTIEIDIRYDDRVEITQGKSVITLNRNFNGYSEPF